MGHSRGTMALGSFLLGAVLGFFAASGILVYSPWAHDARVRRDAVRRQQRCYEGIRQFRLRNDGQYPSCLGEVVSDGVLSVRDIVYLRYDRIVTIGYMRPAVSAPDDSIILYDNASVVLPPSWPRPLIPAIAITDISGETRWRPYSDVSEKKAVDDLRHGASRSMLPAEDRDSRTD